MRKNVIVFFQLKENKRRINKRRRMRRIVSQPNMKSVKSTRLKSTKSESNLILLKQKKEVVEPVIKFINPKANILAKSIQDFEFAYQIKHSANMSSMINSFFLFSLFIYTIECKDEQKYRITFIISCLIIFQVLNR